MAVRLSGWPGEELLWHGLYVKVLCRALISSFHCFMWGMQTGVRISFEYLKAFRLPLSPKIVFLSFFATFKITPRVIKMLYLHILQADSTGNWNAFCKLIVLNNYKIIKKSRRSVLRYIEGITGSVGSFVGCICVNTLKTSISGNQEEASRNRKITLFSPFFKGQMVRKGG